MCGWVGGGDLQIGTSKRQWMGIVLGRKKQLFQYVRVTEENQMIYLFYVGKFQSSDSRNDLWLQCLFNSQAIELSP